MTFQPSAPHKKRRWLALLAILVIGATLSATSVFADLGLHAIPNGSFLSDDAGANDEPGQKDLTAQGSTFHEGDFYTGWKWDDTSWSGKNSGDGCNLFTSDAPDGNADFVVCATIGTEKGALVLQTVTVYSCSDGHPQRCTNPETEVVYSGSTAATYCVISNTATGQFGGTDTVIVCNITDIAADSGVTALASSNIINTCSYPSREPNSDPSDCIFDAPDVNVALTTSSTGSVMTSWSATLKDTATLTPAGTGSVTFGLYTDSTCTTLVAGSESTDTAAPFAATDVVVDNTDVSGAGPYEFFWKVTYNPDPGFLAPAPVCGEKVTITVSVVGSTG
jgi:hypothetical protein